MKKNILITGGLGYLGSEIAKIYSGVSWYHKIIIIDKNFHSERVSQITKWNIEFYQGDILDLNFLKKYDKILFSFLQKFLCRNNL